LRANATLHQLAPPRPPKGQRTRGRPPTKGAQLPKLDQITTNRATKWHKTTVRRYAKTEQVIAYAIESLWYDAIRSQTRPGGDHPRHHQASGYELALVSTGLQASAA